MLQCTGWPFHAMKSFFFIICLWFYLRRTGTFTHGPCCCVKRSFYSRNETQQLARVGIMRNINKVVVPCWKASTSEAIKTAACVKRLPYSYRSTTMNSKHVFKKVNQDINRIFDQAGHPNKVAIVAIDYAKDAHTTLICDAQGRSFKAPFEVNYLSVITQYNSSNWALPWKLFGADCGWNADIYWEFETWRVQFL